MESVVESKYTKKQKTKDLILKKIHTIGILSFERRISLTN
jgi:hypothetical protein